jgi:hypothetical protein
LTQEREGKKFYLPNFLCIGTYRAGTTWLQNVFFHHPEIFVPFEKELFYFSHNYYRGINWYLNFYTSNKYKHIGEVCPAYLGCQDAPARIKTVLGDIKLIAIIRNPFEQIISMYKHHVIRGKINLSFEDAILKNKNFINNIMYACHIQNYWKYFPQNNLLIMIFDDMIKNKKDFLKKIFLFLDVDFFYHDIFDKKVNKSGIPKIKNVDSLIATIGDFFREKNLYMLKKLIKKTGIVDLLKKLNRIEASNDNYIFPDGVILKINNEINKLEELLQQDFSHWKR